jgi:hypothetical protein
MNQTLETELIGELRKMRRTLIICKRVAMIGTACVGCFMLLMLIV